MLGNEARAKLLLCLSQKAKNISDLIQACGLSQSAVSQHLAKLKSARLVETKKEGKEIIYSLKHKKAAEITFMINDRTFYHGANYMEVLKKNQTMEFN